MKEPDMCLAFDLGFLQMAKCPDLWALARLRGRPPRGSAPRPWTFQTIGSPNGAAVDKTDDWVCTSGPRMDFFDDWEIKMDVSDDWETENVSQSCKTSTMPL